MATNRGDDNKESRDQSREESSRALVGMATGMGFSLLVFVAGGVFLDSVFKTTPIFLLVGIFFALATIAIFLWRIATAR